MKRYITLLFVFLAFASAVATAKTVTLRNNRVSMSFVADGAQWAMTEFTSNGQNLLPAGGSKTNLWKITYLGPRGETPVLQPQFTKYKGATLSEDGRSVTFEWSVLIEREDKWPIKATVSLPEDDSELPVWTIAIDMPKKWLVSEIEYPRISVARPENVKGIMAVGYGAEYPLPVSGDMIQSTYPSCTGALQLIMAHNPEGTFYMAAHDMEGASKYFQIRGEGSMITFVQKVETSYGWTDKKGHFSLPWETVMGYNADTWENTVLKWYRPFALKTPWGEKSLAERNIAPWMLDADVWIRPQDVDEEQMEGVRKSVEIFGKDLGVHWYYWHNYPHDSYYPEYFPEKPNFKEYVAECQALGAHVTPYINGRLWDTATDTYAKKNGKKASCRKKDGSLYTEIYSSRIINSVTCPSSPIWQNIQYDLNKKILNDLGTDGVYIDQIGCAASMPCYATNHSHAPGAGSWWPQSYREMLTRIRTELFNENQALTTEEDAECYIDLFDMMLIVNGPHSATVHMVPLFPLVYGDRCVYSGFTYVPWWNLNNGSYNFMQMKSLLWGAQLGWINPVHLFKAGNENEITFLKNLGEFRKANHDVFVGGQFLGEFAPEGDNPIIDVPNYQKTPAVMGAKWKSVDGEDVIILVNMNRWTRKVILPDGEEVSVPGFGAVRK